MLVANVVAEKARHGTHGPRMAMRFIGRAIERHFSRIEADAGPRLAQAGVDIFFAGHEIDRAGLRFVRQDKSISVSSGDFFHALATSSRVFPANC